jgi:hypothetical protein
MNDPSAQQSDDLIEADRRIAISTRKIADQLALIERMEMGGDDPVVLIRALDQMRESLRRWQTDRSQILLRRELEREA